MIWYPWRHVYSVSVCVHMSTRTAFMIGNDTHSYECMQGWSWTSWICVKDMLYSRSRKLRHLSKKQNLQSVSRENFHCSDIKTAECNQRLRKKMRNRWRTRTRWAVSPKSKMLRLVIRRPHAGRSKETLEEGVISIMPTSMWCWDKGWLRKFSSVWHLSEGYLTLLRASSPAVRTWERVSSTSRYLSAFCPSSFRTGFCFPLFICIACSLALLALSGSYFWKFEVYTPMKW